MASPPAWEGFLQAEAERLCAVYLTDSQFENVIRQLLAAPDCPLEGLEYEVHCAQPFPSRNLGVSGAGVPDSQAVRLSDNRDTMYRVKRWDKGAPPPKPDTLNALLRSLFESYWKASLRTESAGMFDLKREVDAGQIARHTVDSLLRKGTHSSLIFCDLDNFKQLNEMLGYEEGNRVIREFGAVLEAVSRRDAVLLHYGGDEFVVLMPGARAEDAILVAYEIARAVDGHDFRTQTLKLGVSQGIATTEVKPDLTSFDDLRGKAGVALIELAKKPKKGRARFPAEYAIADNESNLSTRLNTAHCLLKSGALGQSPFACVWLNSLSRVVTRFLEAGSSPKEIMDPAVDFIRWADLDFLPAARCKAARPREEGLDAGPYLARVDLALSIAHGLLRYALLRQPGCELSWKLFIAYDPEGAGCTLRMAEGDVVWSTGSSAASRDEFEIGSCWRIDSPGTISGDSVARAMLIQVGHEELSLPSTLFAEKIVIDDRPARGGGLPDFWEATIARLVAQIVRNPNIAAVYLLGNHEFGSWTVGKLKDVGSWKQEDKVEQIAYKTGMPANLIRSASSLLTDKIFFPENPEELVGHLAEVLRPRHLFRPPSAYASSQKRPSVLHRSLEIKDWALAREDGCRAKTIAQAYPLVLEIARQAIEQTPIRDQAGLELRELIDFKVRLSTPNIDTVPMFYAQDAPTLEEYFRKQFLTDGGLFAEAFKEGGQLEAVLTHVVSIISDPTRRFATRRAILVVPHKIDRARELSPLGLVAVRVIPRFLNDRCRLDYSYTWRTVEALVGFPFSLYGSVKFGHHLTEQIRGRLPAQYSRGVDMGEVSYIANSLHIFLDDFGQNIAKRIVDDASS